MHVLVVDMTSQSFLKVLSPKKHLPLRMSSYFFDVTIEIITRICTHKIKSIICICEWTVQDILKYIYKF